MFLLKKRTSTPSKPTESSIPTVPPPPLYKRITLVVDKKSFILIAGNDFLEIELETGKIIKKGTSHIRDI